MEKVQKMAYICAPYRGETEEDVKANIRRAQQYARIAHDRGWYPVVPHFFTEGLWGYDTKGDEVDREIIAFNLNLLRSCDVLIKCGATTSRGMAYELDWCRKNGKPILFHEDWKDLTGGA